jgi:hypothetical protein
LSDEYGVTDLDGARPDYAVLDAAVEQAKKTFLAPMFEGQRSVSVDWRATRKDAKS